MQKEKSIWQQPLELDQLNQLSQNTLAETLGIRFTGIGPDYLVATMPVDHRTRQPMGLLHGGANVSLAETMGSVASVACLPDVKAQTVVGIEINANHLRAVREGTVTGTCTPLRIGRRMHVWQIDIRDEQDRLSCTSRLTIAVIERK